MAKLLGKAPNQVPTNADLGSMAFQDREGINVNTAVVANLVVTGATSVNTTFAVTNATSNVAFFASNGNIGIQTSAPTWPLQINANAAYFGAFNTTGGTTVFVDSPTAQTASIVFRQGGGNAVDIGTRKSNTDLLVIRQTSSGTERFTFDASIAKATATGANAQFAVEGTGQGRAISVYGNGTITETGIQLKTNASSVGYAMLATGNNFILKNDSVGYPGLYLSTANVVSLFGGNVAITTATSAPASADATLAVTGTANVSGNVVIGGTYLAFPNAPNTNFSSNTTHGFTIARDNIGDAQNLKITESSTGHYFVASSRLDNQKPVIFNVTATGNTAADYGFTVRVEGSDRLKVNNTITTISSDVNITGNTTLLNATITGNLTVSGTTTYINTTTLNIGDNIITLNADLPGATAPTENAGIEVNRGSSSNVSFFWNESGARWEANSGNNAINELRIVSNTYTRTMSMTGGGLVDSWGTVANTGEFATFNISSGVNKLRTNSRDYYISNTASDLLMVSAANGNVGIANITPGEKFVIEGVAARIQSDDASTKFTVINRGNNTTGRFPQLVVQHYSGNTTGGDTGGQPVVELIHLRGNTSVVQAITSSDILGGFNTWGSNATNILSATRIQGIAEANFTTTATAGLQFFTTNAGTQTEVVRMAANGNVGIGNTTPAQKLVITGTSNTTGIAYHGANVVLAGGSGAGIVYNATADGASVLTKPNSNSTVSQRLEIIGVGSNNAFNPFWSGIHLSPGEGPFTNSTSGNAFPRLSMYYSYTNLTNPTDLVFNFVPGNASGIPQTVRLYSATAAGTQSGIDIAANGNIGIGNTTPIDKLSVAGNIVATGNVVATGSVTANNLRRYTQTRTLSTTVNDTIEIGTLVSQHGAHNLDITLQTTDSGFSTAKRYQISSCYNATNSATYRKVLPLYDAGPFVGNDYDLEAYHNNDTIGLRLRRTAGSTAGVVEILIDDLLLQSEGAAQDYFTPSSTTATAVAAVAENFPGSRVINTGVSHATPNTFIVQANLTTAAITSNNTFVTMGLPVIFNSYTQVGNFAQNSLGLTTSATTANQVITTAAAASWRSLKIFVQVTSGSSYQATEITLIHDGTNVYKSEYGQVFSGAVLATFDADINSGNIRLLTTPVNAVTVYKGAITYVSV